MKKQRKKFICNSIQVSFWGVSSSREEGDWERKKKLTFYVEFLNQDCATMLKLKQTEIKKKRISFCFLVVGCFC